MMQASDLILGMLIIFLLGWTVMLAVGQRGLDVAVNAISVRQASGSVLFSPNYCKQVAGYALVMATSLQEKEYLTTVGFNHDTNQSFLCFYEQD